MSLNDTDAQNQTSASASHFQDRVNAGVSVAGNQAYDFLRHWVSEGNARRLVVRHNNQDLVQLPLTVAVVATVFAPQLVAFGIVAAILSGCSMEVRHIE